MNKYDVVTIGAGVIGCSIALALSKRGLRTLNVDSLPAAGYGSTSHSSAIIRPIYSHLTSCAIAHESRFLWQDWQNFLGVVDDRGFAQYTECGGIVLIREGEEHLYEDNLSSMSAVGVEYELLNASEIEKLYPGITLTSFGPPKTLADEKFGQTSGGKITSAILVPAAGYVSDPQLASHNLQMAAKNHGADFMFNAPVSTVITDKNVAGGVVLKNGDVISSGITINASGPHSSIINQMAGIADSLKITTRAVRHEVVYLPADARHFQMGGRFLVDTDAGFYQRPDGADLLIGTTDPECDGMNVVNPDHYNASFTEQWTLQAYRAAQRFPELGISNTARGTVGLYDVSDDWIPIYDKSDLGGFYLAIGTSGNQFKNAPLAGEIMAEIIVRDRNGGNHDTEPASLHLPHLQRTVGLDFYSRNRTIQATTSVMA
ncbi:MAG: FAD-dependent oxidoreductase [Pseudomonadales bacterium]|jgi:sarcosine oxidase subunit beta